MVPIENHVVETYMVGHGVPLYRTLSRPPVRLILDPQSSTNRARDKYLGETEMGLVNTTSLVHFSLPVNDLEESLKFYTEVLGMKFRGNVGKNGRCVMVGETPIILCGRDEA